MAVSILSPKEVLVRGVDEGVRLGEFKVFFFRLFAENIHDRNRLLFLPWFTVVGIW